jgi:hypothetical protein
VIKDEKVGIGYKTAGWVILVFRRLFYNPVKFIKRGHPPKKKKEKSSTTVISAEINYLLPPILHTSEIRTSTDFPRQHAFHA